MFEIILLVDTLCRCVGLSFKCPALTIASLQFLSVLLAEEEKRRVQDKDKTNEGQAPTVALLLDGTQGSLSSSERLNETILQVCDFLTFFFF
jgi:rotatin